jgi:F-type H+-transporting ATPase subunit gamma
MPSLKDIRKRVVSVKNTQKITRAMKLVAAAKLRRAQGAMMELRPYAEKYRELLGSLVQTAGGDEGQAPHELLAARSEPGAVAILAISSDRGMCGAFNSASVKSLSAFVTEVEGAGRRAVVYPLGRRIVQFVSKNEYEVGESFGEVIPSAETSAIKKITATLVNGFLEGEFDEVVIISNRFRSVIAQIPMTSPLIPVQTMDEDEVEGGDAGGDFLYEPGEETLLGYVVPTYIEVQVREAILESIAGEHAARMNAMNSATDNATEMISSLTLQMNRARQAAITTELMEIIGGAEAIK